MWIRLETIYLDYILFGYKFHCLPTVVQCLLFHKWRHLISKLNPSARIVQFCKAENPCVKVYKHLISLSYSIFITRCFRIDDKMLSKDDESNEEAESGTMTLDYYLSNYHLPLLVRLESGFRGEVEELSFSQGDSLALHTRVDLKGQPVVLAYYVVGD